MAKPSHELTPSYSSLHLFGYTMRRHRRNEEWSLAKLSDLVSYDRTHLYRIEIGERRPPQDLAASLDIVFDTDKQFTLLWELVNKETFPNRYRRYMDYESRATVLQTYMAQSVDGLLQTEEYARAQLRAGNPHASEDELEEKVQARMGRKRLLTADPPSHLWGILDEAVIRRPVGGEAVMRRQLGHLAEFADSPTVKLQVLPFSHGEHALMGGSLTILRLKDHYSWVAYKEGNDFGQLFENQDEVTQFQLSYDLLRAYALPPKESAAFLRAAMEDSTLWEPPGI
ncbi:helix-turn-helix domain-containing protein [Streptomyces gobiensis]|uniref:helix-turn-helix domain-containing protein n=1 Tax=Streptomyces gobiensis TaxID=2875706 RepID=UPI001E3238CA|nr:helix-turn-helix transcriptional regulator [Streptomyces gobiensis]UGY92586.1 helix-turn-helix transcriptional regulator [Streptomyces gobiensis]